MNEEQWSTPQAYEIRFQGHLDLRRARMFEGLEMVREPGGETVLRSPVLDQAAYAIVMSLPTKYVSFGEECGRRAYLQQKLMPLGPRKAVLLVGVIWAMWHWPAIFQGQQYLFGYWGEPVVGPLLWVWTLLPVSVLYGWLMLRSGSVWPAAIAHGVHNATRRLLFWFLSGPLDVLVGPGAGGIVGSLAISWLPCPSSSFRVPWRRLPAGNRVLRSRLSTWERR